MGEPSRTLWPAGAHATVRPGKPAPAAFPRGLTQQLAQLAGLRLDGLARPGPQFLEVTQAGVMDAAGLRGAAGWTAGNERA